MSESVLRAFASPAAESTRWTQLQAVFYGPAPWPPPGPEDCGVAGGFQAPSAVLLMRLVDRPSLPVPGAWPKGPTYPQDRGGRPAVRPSPVGCGRRIAHLLTRDEVQRQGRGLGERYGPPPHP